ncbi:unnamed protein product [Penicillium pancosmium]
MANTPPSMSDQGFSKPSAVTRDDGNFPRDAAASQQSTLSRAARYGDNWGINREFDFKRIDRIGYPNAAETMMDYRHPMPIQNMPCAESPSFAGKTTGTPTSLMSFDTTLDTPRDDAAMSHGLAFHGTNLPAFGDMMPHHPQSVSFSGNEVWPPRHHNVDPWRPQLGADPAWSTQEDLYSGWHDLPSLSAPAMDPRSSSRQYSHLSTSPVFAPLMGFPDHKSPTSCSGDFNFSIPQTSTAYQTSQYHAYDMQAPVPAPAPAVASASPPTPMSLAYLSKTASQGQIQPQGWTEHDTPTSIHGSHASSLEPHVRLTSRQCSNAFLVECKRKGLSYKDIKRIGGFTEAESTLRGRYRNLTKAKEQRVRKPKWTDADIQLLCEGVDLYTEKTVRPNLAANAAISAMNTTPSAITTPASVSVPAPVSVTPVQHQQMQAQAHQSPKISWKKVSEHIAANGGSYKFGNATCKKKWYEIHDL